MKTSLTNGLTEEQKRIITEEFTSSVNLRARLVGLLEAKQTALRSERIAKTSYDSPSWAYAQADTIGYERAVSELISLLTSKK